MFFTDWIYFLCKLAIVKYLDRLKIWEEVGPEIVQIAQWT